MSKTYKYPRSAEVLLADLYRVFVNKLEGEVLEDEMLDYWYDFLEPHRRQHEIHQECEKLLAEPTWKRFEKFKKGETL